MAAYILGKIDSAVFDWLSHMAIVLAGEIQDKFKGTRANSVISLKPPELPTPDKSESDPGVEMNESQSRPNFLNTRAWYDWRLWSAFLVIALLVTMLAIKIQSRRSFPM